MKKIIAVLLFALCGYAGAVDQPNQLGYSSVQMGALNFVPSVYGITFSTNELPASSSYLVLNSSGGNILMTSKPTVSTATVMGGSTFINDGAFLVLTTTNTTSKIMIQDNGTLSGSLLNLGLNVTTEVVSSSRPVALIYNKTANTWVQISPPNGTF